MTIADIGQKCKSALGSIPRDILLISVLVGASGASFGLGFLAGRDYDTTGQGSAVTFTTTPSGAPGEVVASKTGTKYYLPSCSGADRIAEENKVYYTSAALARAQHYEPADNCDGLE